MYYVVHVSSNTNNGTNAGAFYVNANNASSNSNRNNGTHLAVSCISKETTPSLLGEYVDPIQLGRETEQLGEQQQ
jgi:hypothetical protein